MRKLIGATVVVLAISMQSAIALSGPSTGNPCKPKPTNGDDTFYGTSGADHLCGGNGKDTLYGLAGKDRLAGNHDSDTLYGGNGDDVIIPGKGVDTVDCGDGWDVVQTNFQPHGETYANCEVFFDPAPK